MDNPRRVPGARMPPLRTGAVGLVLAALPWGWGCPGPGDAGPPGDVGPSLADGRGGGDTDPSEPCAPGSRRCLTADTVGVCRADGTGFEARSCPPGQGCGEEGVCAPRVCDPGRVLECRDAKTVRRCNGGGTAEDVLRCGEGELCREGEGCVPRICRPEETRCAGDDLVEKCRQDGTGWEPYEECDGARTSRVCEDGRCIALCERAAKHVSYIGCEYWAVDMDNAFVEGDSPSGYYDAQGKQFAVVVSNVNDALPARITVDNADGKLWCRPWEDLPGTYFPYEPETFWCQKSLDECTNTPRCETITEQAEGDRTITREVCTVQGGGECVSEVLVPPHALRVLNLPRQDVNGTTVARLAWRITSSIPITAYQFNPLENEGVYSNDASLLLPTSSLGKEYLVMTREQTFQILRSYLTVVAVRPGETNVIVQVTAPTLPGRAGREAIEALEPGMRRRFVLRQFDVLNLETRCTADPRGYCRDAPDLTGSEVFSDKLVAVFGGSEASDAPNDNHCLDEDGFLAFATGRSGWCYDRWHPEAGFGTETPCQDNADCSRFITCCADHLEHQLLPRNTWGVHYVLAKSFDRGLEKDVYRILAGSDDTRVETIPSQADIPVLGRGQWFEFQSREDFEIRSNKAILVGQFLAGEQAPHPNPRGTFQRGDARTGDPAFLLAVPIEQFRNSYVFLNPDKYEYDYVTLVAPTGTRILLDEEPVPFEEFVPVADGLFSAARLPVSDGVHTVRSLAEDGMGEGPEFGITVYGYDQYVSYGYAGGLNLGRINTCRNDLECPDGTVCREGDCVPR